MVHLAPSHALDLRVLWPTSPGQPGYALSRSLLEQSVERRLRAFVDGRIPGRPLLRPEDVAAIRAITLQHALRPRLPAFVVGRRVVMRAVETDVQITAAGLALRTEADRLDGGDLHLALASVTPHPRQDCGNSRAAATRPRPYPAKL